MRNQLLLWTLSFSIIISTLPGKEGEGCRECEGSAYTESWNAASWTPYLPIAVLVVAAIYIGTSDVGERHSSKGYSSHGGSYRKDCYDGLGPLSSRSCTHSSYTYARNYTRCKVCLSH